MTTQQQLTGLFTVLALVGICVGGYLWWTYPHRSEQSRQFSIVRTDLGSTDNTQANPLLASQSLAVELVDYQQ